MRINGTAVGGDGEKMINWVLFLTIPLYIGAAIYEFGWSYRPFDGGLYLTFAASNVIMLLRGIYV